MKTTYTCEVCFKNIRDGDEWICERCEGWHHPRCSAEHGGNGGEYPAESEYSICKKCTREDRERHMRSVYIMGIETYIDASFQQYKNQNPDWQQQSPDKFYEHMQHSIMEYKSGLPKGTLV